MPPAARNKFKMLIASVTLLALALAPLAAAQAGSCNGLSDDAYWQCMNCLNSAVPGATASTANDLDIYLLFSLFSSNPSRNLCRACGDIPDSWARNECFQCIQSSEPKLHTECLRCMLPDAFEFEGATMPSGTLVDIRTDYTRMAKCFSCMQQSGYIDLSTGKPRKNNCLLCAAAKSLDLMDKCIQCINSPALAQRDNCLPCIAPTKIYSAELKSTSPFSNYNQIFGSGENSNSHKKCLDCVTDGAADNQYPFYPLGRCFAGALIDDDQLADKYFQCVRSSVPGSRSSLVGAELRPVSYCDACMRPSRDSSGTLIFVQPKDTNVRSRCLDGLMRLTASPGETIAVAVGGVALCSLYSTELQQECLDCASASQPYRSQFCQICANANIPALNSAGFNAFRPIFGSGSSPTSRRRCMQCLMKSPPPGVALTNPEAYARCTLGALFEDSDAAVRDKYFQCAESSEPGNVDEANTNGGVSTRNLCDRCITYGLTAEDRIRCMDCLMKSTPDKTTINQFNIAFISAARTVLFNQPITPRIAKWGCYACAQRPTPDAKAQCYNCMESSVPSMDKKSTCFPGGV